MELDLDINIWHVAFEIYYMLLHYTLIGEGLCSRLWCHDDADLMLEREREQLNVAERGVNTATTTASEAHTSLRVFRDCGLFLHHDRPPARGSKEMVFWLLLFGSENVVVDDRARESDMFTLYKLGFASECTFAAAAAASFRCMEFCSSSRARARCV